MTHTGKGWKVVYSGDTRPCERLCEVGQGATVLVHEATFEDELQAEAAAKKHRCVCMCVRICLRESLEGFCAVARSTSTRFALSRSSTFRHFRRLLTYLFLSPKHQCSPLVCQTTHLCNLVSLQSTPWIVLISTIFRSTTLEAVESGAKMGAELTMLTHFSQRYPKIPKIDPKFSAHTGIAFDLMNLGTFPVWRSVACSWFALHPHMPAPIHL